jgi:hypothetical protein
MKLPRQALLATLVSLATLAASRRPPRRRPGLGSPAPPPGGHQAAAASFSTEIPLVSRYPRPAPGTRARSS